MKVFKRVLTGLVLGLMLSVSVSPQAGTSATTVIFATVQPTGTVRVAGNRIGTDFQMSSGSRATTAKGSSAVVSLGKLGRVEMHESSDANISWDGGGIRVALEAGRVRVSSGSGFRGRVSTRDGEIVSASSSESEFTVDTSCGNTVVSTQSGRVELRAGGSVKQIAAGSQDSAGTAKPGKCKGRTT